MDLISYDAVGQPMSVLLIWLLWFMKLGKPGRIGQFNAMVGAV
jgi:hypothetical protein